MLKRTYRLRKNSDFQRLYRSGRRHSTPNFTLYYISSHLAYSQVGFVVSKKVAKSAVVRNTLRRRASAIVEELYPKISNPTKLIILIRKDFSDTKPSDLKSEISLLLNKITS